MAPFLKDGRVAQLPHGSMHSTIARRFERQANAFVIRLGLQEDLRGRRPATNASRASGPPWQAGCVRAFRRLGCRGVERLSLNPHRRVPYSWERMVDEQGSSLREGVRNTSRRTSQAGLGAATAPPLRTTMGPRIAAAQCGRPEKQLVFRFD
jgi:hypothetical protein